MERERVLVVDDNLINLKLIQVILEMERYEVATATNARDALARVATWRPRLVLTDLQLPGMDGLELTRHIKADPRLRGTIVVAITAYAMRGDEAIARAAGCDGYLAKPLDTKALPAQLARFLAAAPGHEADDARPDPGRR